MIFRQLFDRKTYTYTYLIASAIGREAIIIDSVKDNVSLYQTLLQELKLKLAIVIDTHVHADHITASGALMQTNQCEVLMGENSKAECVSIRVKDNEKIHLDGLELIAMSTPGHTDESYSFYMKDRVFTGDTLLIRGTGRTDFQNGSAEQQYHSLFDKLLKLPEDTLVYPAHDYNGMTVSTITEEKQFNPRLQVTSKQEYVDLMNKLDLAKPELMDIAVPANLKCGR